MIKKTVTHLALYAVTMTVFAGPLVVFGEEGGQLSTTTPVVTNQAPLSVSSSIAPNPSSEISVQTVATSTQTKAAPQSECTSPIPVGTLLRKGVKDGKNKYVTKLQRTLFANGYLKAQPNGYFGVATYGAVRLFQKDNGFLVTGIVGPYSLAKINELSCGSQDGGQVKIVPPPSAETQTTSSTDTQIDPANAPKINSFSLIPVTDGSQVYTADIGSVDTVSLKAICPTGVVEVKNGVGLTKIKVDESSSVCTKEKFLFVGDSNQGSSFVRTQTPMVFTDREGIPSWFAYDASTTPTSSSVQITLKACHQSICIQKKTQVLVNSFYQRTVTKELGLGDIKVDSSQNLFINAYNFNRLTVKPGCPYNVQTLDSVGNVLSDENSPCNVEKDVVNSPDTLVASYDKPEGISLKSLGFIFDLRPINGQVDSYANVEINVKACSGVQAEKLSSSTLRCVEKPTYFPIYSKNK